MRLSRYALYFFAMFLFVVSSVFTPAAYAANVQEDLSSLNGLWVVDYRETKALWEKAKIAEIELLPMMGEAYMLDMDFSAGTMIEGTSFSESPERIPFSVSRGKEGSLIIKKDEGDGKSKTFIWKMRSDGKALVKVGKTAPTIIMMRCDYSKYAGKWRLDIPANEGLVTMLSQRASEAEKESFMTELADSYMIFSFSRGDFEMRWETGAGERIYRPFPSGTFTVSQYAERECWLVGENEIFLNFRDDDYIIFFFVADDISLSLKRVAE